MLIDKKLTIGNVERHLEKIDGALTAFTLDIPKHFQSQAFGGEISAVQFLLTWAQEQTTRARLYLDDKDDDLADYTRELIGLVLALVVDEPEAIRGGGTLRIPLRDAGLATLAVAQGQGPERCAEGAADRDPLRRPSQFASRCDVLHW